MGGWGDSAAQQNRRDVSGYRSAWNAPSSENNSWRSPTAKDRKGEVFHGDDVEWSDKPGSSFSTRKRHGWWGKEERFDVWGRRVG